MLSADAVEGAAEKRFSRFSGSGRFRGEGIVERYVNRLAYRREPPWQSPNSATLQH
ncbi:hypothetical protein RM6536_1130 [Rothia mucilaginosa]|uniref:Uncharacterized protein n=1 Tax=Rothia mucilaginosa TaxID=43675 RepID=A0A0K2S0M3_9MICC|nr:hypothetical protein RM6536_1130 [Rothia mucilaginosa]